MNSEDHKDYMGARESRSSKCCFGISVSNHLEVLGSVHSDWKADYSAENGFSKRTKGYQHIVSEEDKEFETLL